MHSSQPQEHTTSFVAEFHDKEGKNQYNLKLTKSCMIHGPQANFFFAAQSFIAQKCVMHMFPFVSSSLASPPPLPPQFIFWLFVIRFNSGRMKYEQVLFLVRWHHLCYVHICDAVLRMSMWALTGYSPYNRFMCREGHFSGDPVHFRNLRLVSSLVSTKIFLGWVTTRW